MDELLQAFGVLLRLPIFCLGVCLWAVVLGPLTLVFIVLSIVCIPFVFLSAAFTNNPEKLRRYIADISFDGWLRLLGEMKDWLIAGSKG